MRFSFSFFGGVGGGVICATGGAASSDVVRAHGTVAEVYCSARTGGLQEC